MKNSTPVLVWFRQDLRVSDNPALLAAVKSGAILPIYILDEAIDPLGAASKVWLYHSLKALDHSLSGHLKIYSGDSLEIIQSIIQRYKIQKLYVNQCYEPARLKQDNLINAQIEVMGCAYHCCQASLLWDPGTVLKKDGTPYKVFTPYYKKGCLQSVLPRQPLEAPQAISFLQAENFGMGIQDLNLLPDHAWADQVMAHWSVGEAAANKCLNVFIEHGLSEYKVGRDFPAQKNTSRLSSYLHFGQISPHQIWYTIQMLPSSDQTEHFLRELVWREFSYYLLYHFPSLPSQNLQAKFDAFPWQNDVKKLKAWQQGQTGIPMVDAGMRELWQTGYMHNRVRMIVASFLVKNLMIDWREGAKWFWGCLLDADLANNSASWQWVAGSGADAAPFFRIFNPVTQGQKFDPQGEYIRQYVSEISHLPDKLIHTPWLSGALLNYPKPIVDLKVSREDALTAFRTLSRR